MLTSIISTTQESTQVLQRLYKQVTSLTKHKLETRMSDVEDD